MNKDASWPAFPTTIHNYGNGMYAGLGMTLRDYFAAKAMAALSQGHYEYEFTGIPRMPEFQKLMDELAIDAYVIADAMLKAREQ